MKRIALCGLLALLLVVSACSPNSPQPTAYPEPTQTAPAAPTSSPVQVTPTREGPVTLRIWLPPEFDPESGSEAGELLANRLAAFSTRRPDVRLEVRIKASDGPGGMLDSLTAANAAAPLALPDLVALPRNTLEAATLKGLLHTYDSLNNDLDDTDWFGYAQQMARVQNSVYGIPFAGDALVLVYRTTTIPTPPGNVTDTLVLKSTLAFPAADPQALFILAQYRHLGGALLDEQDKPFLDVALLGELFGYYQEYASAEVTPFWLTQYQTDAQAWQAYTDSQVDLVVTWASRFLKDRPPNSLAAPLPMPDGNTSTLARGWSWGLVSGNPETQRLCVQLVEFLTESNFMAAWNQAAGYLPARASAMPGWQTDIPAEMAADILASAELIPPSDVLNILGPPLQIATAEILKQITDPLVAAQNAASKLEKP
jgi:ABC-type glycerol-3-phosphate transport system substrate-binding protein